MAQTLSPELLAQLQALQQSDGSLMSGGSMYQPLYSQMQGADAGPAQMLGYASYDPNKKEVGKDSFQQYNPDGSFSHEAKFRDPEGNLLPIALAAMAGLGFGLPALMGQAGGTSAMGAGAAGLESGTLASGVTVGGPMSVGLPVGTSLPAMGAMGGAAGGALGSAAGGGGTATMGAGAATGGGGLLSQAGGALSSIGGAGGLLGAAAPLLGAVAGSQGTEGQTQENRMDPRMDSYIYGDLLPRTQGLLARQQPIAEQQGQLMRQFGQGLLSQGVARNPFTTR